MSRLPWSAALSLDLPEMDAGLKTFVTLLGRVHEATDASLVSLWRELLGYTAQVFEREDRWMHISQFSSAQLHTMQHKVVLQVMNEGLLAGESGDLALIRKMVDELGQWFANHSQSMDAALALHLRKTGYNPATGMLSMPDEVALGTPGQAAVQA